ncbi:diguanylate cyclase [Cytobacillus spongiae]|nr:histidine kinase N-terminal 7TM domain-containing protein [Cytobacillus spongiae]UII58011.1 diguanylate cyclase [Cytobacillus spongiae]
MVYITLVCTSSVLNLYLCVYVFLKRRQFTNIAQIFVIYAAAITIYCMASAFGLMSTSLAEIKFWTTIQYIGLSFSPPLGLLFIMQYLGFNLTKKKYAALLIIPFITLIIVATNDIHHLHYRVFELDVTLGAPFVHQEIGKWYIVHGFYTFASMLVAFILAISHWRETAKIYRPQFVSILFGQLIPMVTAFIYLVGLTPPGIDPVPMTLWLTSLLYFWSISSSRLFTIMPIAKDAIFNSINDGVIVLDDSNRIIEYNLSSQKMFPQLSNLSYGSEFTEAWKRIAGEIYPFQLGVGDLNEELELVTNDFKRTYQVRASSVTHASNGSGQLLIFTDITELKSLQGKLESYAFYDELTQIFNRRAFFQKCEQLFNEAQHSESNFAIVLMDIDFFKKVNDTYGHVIGDQLLKHVAQVCQTLLQNGELFARYGGEEFVLALRGYSESEGRKLADQMRIAIERNNLHTAKGELSVTLSLGVAQALKNSYEDLNNLLNKADQALYAAKKAGRNQVKVYSAIDGESFFNN